MLNGFFERNLKTFSGSTSTNNLVENINCGFREFEKAHPQGAVLSLAAGKQGICFSAGYNHEVVAYDYFLGKRVKRWLGHQQQVTRVAYGEQCGLVASASRDKTIRFWRDDQTEAIATIDAHKLPITGLDFSPDNKIVCSGSRDNTVKTWDVSTGTLLKSSDTRRNLVTHVKWAPELNTVVQTSEDKEVRLWDTRTLEVITTFPVKQYMQMHCDVTADERYVLTCSNGTNGNGCEASLWDVRKCRLLREFRGHQQTINSCILIKLTEVGHYHVVTASQDNTLRLWNCHTTECLNITSLDGSGALNDVVALDDDSLGVATYHDGIHRLLRGFQYTGHWIMKKVSTF